VAAKNHTFPIGRPQNPFCEKIMLLGRIGDCLGGGALFVLKVDFGAALLISLLL